MDKFSCFRFSEFYFEPYRSRNGDSRVAVYLGYNQNFCQNVVHKKKKKNLVLMFM